MKNIHVISHSHWDREWYMPFEYHRSYLIKLIDECIGLFENDENFKNFHLDGHTALVEDYLEIKPENLDKIKKYVKEGRFSVGPWYVLQDEFLTSSEANVRNLLIGNEIAESLGKITKIGYFPDAFGNAGQMPQLLKQAGMEAIVFGRGVRATGKDNKTAGDYSSPYSELYWQSPDGSSLPSIMFANWYSNGMQMPNDGNKAYWDNTISRMERFASTDELLLMNGCDHQPVQTDLAEALANAKKNYPDYNFIHSNFRDYVKALIPNLPSDLATIKGELIGQDADGWTSLVNTCSANVDLKVMNRKNEILLESIAEPLSVMAAELGKEYPKHMLTFAWKTLMKNHPHDSICGCSCDEVNYEIESRFVKSTQAAQKIVNDDLDYIAKFVDTTGLEGCDAVFTVVNTFGQKRTKTVSLDLDVRRIYSGNYQKLGEAGKSIRESLYRGEYELVDQNGNTVPCSVENVRQFFGYDLPDRLFRQPYMTETVTLSFEAENVPSMGYKVYGLRKTDKKPEKSTLVTAENTMENDFIKVNINSDGTINVTDKSNGKVYSELLRFEDTGDVGSEYTYVPTKGFEPIYSGGDAEIELVRDEPFTAEYKITVKMTIPVSADDEYYVERDTVVPLRERKSGRSDELVTMDIVSHVSLSKNGRSVGIKTEFENKAKNHRLRVLLPTGLKTSQHKVESVFESATRNNRHKPTFTYPSGCEHQQGFVMMNDGKNGFAAANIGLYEYEIVNDDTIAITLVRAVDELGDWGVFPTKRSQQLKELSLEYSLIPFTNESEAYNECKSFAVPMLAVQVTEHNDTITDMNGILNWDGNMIVNTAFKKSQKREDIIMRYVNYSDREQVLTVYKTDAIDNLYKSNVIEEVGEPIEMSDGKWMINVKPFEIITLGCEKR